MNSIHQLYSTFQNEDVCLSHHDVCDLVYLNVLE